MLKKCIAILLSVTLLVTSISISPATAYAADSNLSISDRCYYATEFGEDYRLSYFYKDAYFSHSAFDEDKSLATMSLVMSLAAGRSDRAANWSDKGQNILALWKALGFTKCSLNKDYSIKPTNNTTAFGCASKKLVSNGKKYTLISLCINGSRLFDEWGGEVQIGSSGDAKKQRDKADEAGKFLKNYISDNNITGNIKLWLTGYGLGSAKINLLAASIDDGLNLGSAVSLSTKDVYAYCFNCPLAASGSNALHSSKYNNIKVYNDPNLFLNYFPPVRYKMGLYGDVHNYPTKNGTSNYSKKLKTMEKMLRTIEGGPNDYTLDDFQMKKASLSEPYILDDTSDSRDLAQFLPDGVDELAKACASTRSAWVSEFQDDCGVLLTYIFGGLDPNWMQGIEYFLDYVKSKLLSVALNIILKNSDNLASIYADGLRYALPKAGVSNYDDKMLVKFSQVLANIMIDLGISHLDFEATFLGNMKIMLLDANDPTISLAWLMSEDPYFLNPDSFVQNSSGNTADLADCTVKLAKTSYVYNGKAKKPAVTIRYQGEQLTKGIDFKVSYKNNKNVGTGKVTIKGINQYTGTITKTFTIKKANGTVNVKNITKVYNKNSRSVALNVDTNSNGDISYSSSNSKIKVSSDGKIKIPAKFIGKSTITIKVAATKNYTAASGKMTIKVNPSKTQIRSLSNSKMGLLEVNWEKNPCASGYQVQISTREDFSVVNSSFPKDPNSYTEKTTGSFKDIPSDLQIFVRMRTVTVVNGNRYYSSWSNKKSIIIK